MKSILAAFVISIFILAPSVLSAATIHVPADQPTIQEGIAAASHGDLVLVAPGTYVEQLNFLGKAIIVLSEEGPDLTVIDGNATGQVLIFNHGEIRETVIEGFTIRNGSASLGGGVFCNNASPTIRNCIITENRVNTSGAGIHCWKASPAIEDCVIQLNHACGLGSMTFGGGISCFFSFPRISNCTISGNSLGNLSGYGGGILLFASSATIRDCTISFNDAESAGGGISCLFSTLVTISGSTISSNDSLFGGGVMCFLSNPSISNCDITGNRGASGAGVMSMFSSPSISGCRIFGNYLWDLPLVPTGGGGIAALGTSSPKIANCEIYDNGGDGVGGGIFCGASAKPIISNCQIHDNIAGGLYCYQWGLPEVSNSILWGNDRGDIINEYLSVAQVTNCVVMDGISSTSALTIVRNSILSGDQVSLEQGSILSIGYSDVIGGQESIFKDESSRLFWLFGNIDADPLFVGAEDYHLTPGSPCIDAGNPNLTFYDLCFPPSIGAERNDIGAYGGPGACGWLSR